MSRRLAAILSLASLCDCELVVDDGTRVLVSADADAVTDATEDADAADAVARQGCSAGCLQQAMSCQQTCAAKQATCSSACHGDGSGPCHAACTQADAACATGCDNQCAACVAHAGCAPSSTCSD